MIIEHSLAPSQYGQIHIITFILTEGDDTPLRQLPEAVRPYLLDCGFTVVAPVWQWYPPHTEEGRQLEIVCCDTDLIEKLVQKLQNTFTAAPVSP